MEDPAWYFSTLTQSVAAVIAFTIAFASTLFNSRIESLQENTDELRQELTNLRDKYSQVLSSTALKLKEAGEFDDPRNVDPRELIDEYGIEQAAIMIHGEAQRLEMSSEEIEEWADNQPNSTIALAWAHLLRSSGLLKDVLAITDNLLSREEIQGLRESADQLNEILDDLDGVTQDLYEEMTDETAESGFHTDEIMEAPEAVTAWLQDNMHEIDEQRLGWPNLEDTTDGTNLITYAIIAEEFQKDIYGLIQHVPGTKLMPLPDPVRAASRLLWITFGLGIAGILLPMLFLITPSKHLNIILQPLHIQIAQILLIVSSVVLAGLLFRELYNFIRQRARDI